MATKVVMPQLGESVVEGTVTRWLIAEGSPVEEFQALLEVNTDKVDTEIPSPASGLLLKILVAEGTTVRAGTPLAWIGQPGETLEDSGAPAAAHSPAVPQPSAPAPAPAPAAGRSRDLGFISPVVAKLAGEFNVDLQQVKGSGENGRITKKDVLAYIEAGKSKAEPAAWETPGEGDLFRPTELQFGAGAKAPAKEPAPVQGTDAGGKLIPHTSMRRAIAAHMLESKRTSPHVTTVMEANLARVVAHRQAHQAAFEREGQRLTFTPYFIAAVTAGLKAVPLANSSWQDEGVLIHPRIHIGMAVSLGAEGLIVPVIRDADNLSLLGLARAVNDLAGRARAHRLQPDEVKGGTFSITNHGTSGSLFATPIINQPQCGILGIGAIQKRAVVLDDAIAIRPMVYLSFTFDHRILDGDSADGFLSSVVKTLENWQ